MQHIEKWRETLIDPIKIKFPCGVKVVEILSYPHAGNDVFICNIMYEGHNHLGILKVERHCDANLRHEYKYLQLLNSNIHVNVSRVFSYGNIDDLTYMFIEYEEGDKLSTIVCEIEEENKVKTSIEYMMKFGENLSRIHNLKLVNEIAVERKFQKIMNEEQSKTIGLGNVNKWLHENKPKDTSYCFIHGDHHHANILWKNMKIECTLDWELCGIGWREFDIAWSIILRPNQIFLKSQIEIDAFLKGYSKYNSFNINHFNYCMVLGYQYFFEIARKSKNEDYEMFIRSEINRFSKHILMS